MKDRGSPEGTGSTGALRHGLAAAVADLTDGQRWTATVAVALGLVVLAFGMPSATRTLADLARAGVGEVAAPAAAAATPTAPAPGAASAGSAGRRALPSSTVTPGPSGHDATSSSSSAPTGTDSPVALPDVIALVQPGTAGDVGRDDASVAKRLLATGRVSARFVEAGEPRATCDAVGPHAFVLASTTVADDLRRCLLDAGAVVVAFDDLGPEASGSGAVASIRLGAGAGLLATATRIPLERAPFAIVADPRLRPSLDAALQVLAAKGVRPQAVTYTAGAVPTGDVTKFRGVGTVLFAGSVLEQSTWASNLLVAAPSAARVVLDAADSVTNEAYPVLFDGATTITSVEGPWADRVADQDVRQARAACRARWEPAQVPPAALTDGETTRELAWCDLAAVASRALDGLRRGASDVLAALGTGDERAALATALGPRAGDPVPFGPTQVVELRWSASCRCWQPTGPPVDRAAP